MKSEDVASAFKVLRAELEREIRVLQYKQAALARRKDTNTFKTVCARMIAARQAVEIAELLVQGNRQDNHQLS